MATLKKIKERRKAMIGSLIIGAVLIAGMVAFLQAYEDAKKAGYVSREYIYGKEKTSNAGTSDVQSIGIDR